MAMPFVIINRSATASISMAASSDKAQDLAIEDSESIADSAKRASASSGSTAFGDERMDRNVWSAIAWCLSQTCRYLKELSGLRKARW